jgi:hypothetical protein
MIPATPTPLPPGVANFTIPTDYTLWGSTSTAIQYWNWLGVIGLFVQGFLLLMIVVIGIKILTNFLNNFTKQDQQE